jgi:cytochrome c oxidase subunit 2
MTKLLILLVIILGILAIAQLARVYELTSRLRGKREEEISDADNRFNGRMMLVFMVAYFAFFLWLVLRYKDRMLPVAASAHGVETDALLNFNWLVLITAFVLTNVLLFWFSYKYIYNKDRRAHWYPHNNRLELVWTVIPAAVLAVIIIYGLTTWNRITSAAGPGAVEVEIYGKQFDWTARYPGKDGILGASDFRLISGTNPLGVVTPTSLTTRMDEMNAEIAEIDSLLAHSILADNRREELTDQAARLRRHMLRLVNLREVMEQDIAEKGPASVYLAGADDIVTKDFYLPKGLEANLLIRSRDVLHSMYIPHMRAQMNAVPGMTTRFKFTPTITTDSMRTHILKDEEFNYVLLCNKICGASHYNMQMPLIVTTPEEYQAWYAEAQKKPFEAPATAEEAEAAGAQEAATAALTEQ